MNNSDEIAREKAYQASRGREKGLAELLDNFHTQNHQKQTLDELKYKKLEKLLYEWLKKNTSLDEFTADHYALNAAEHVRDLVHTSGDNG